MPEGKRETGLPRKLVLTLLSNIPFGMVYRFFLDYRVRAKGGKGSLNEMHR